MDLGAVRASDVLDIVIRFNDAKLVARGRYVAPAPVAVDVGVECMREQVACVCVHVLEGRIHKRGGVYVVAPGSYMIGSHGMARIDADR